MWLVRLGMSAAPPAYSEALRRSTLCVRRLSEARLFSTAVTQRASGVPNAATRQKVVVVGCGWGG